MVGLSMLASCPGSWLVIDDLLPAEALAVNSPVTLLSTAKGSLIERGYELCTS